MDNKTKETLGYLNADKFYMNPATGSVDNGASWEDGFFDYLGNLAGMWQEWGGNTLIEVIKDESGEWVEVD